MTATISTTVATSLLPAGLVAGMKVQGVAGRKTRVLLCDDAATVQATDTRWGGGSRNGYFRWTFGTDACCNAYAAENEQLGLPSVGAVVEECVFMGKTCATVVYVRASAVFSMFGYRLPEGMPADVGCDWLGEQADGWAVKPRDAQRMRKTVATVRFLLGQTAAVVA